MVMKFKNMRRPARAEKVGLSVPPAKKTKISDETSPNTTLHLSSSTSDYDLHVDHLKQSYNSGKWSVTSMALALGETALQRREWISQSNPSGKDINR